MQSRLITSEADRQQLDGDVSQYQSVGLLYNNSSTLAHSLIDVVAFFVSFSYLFLFDPLFVEHTVLSVLL